MPFRLGLMVGILGATSVQLKRGKNPTCSGKRRQGNRLEFSLSWFVARRSIQLSYGRILGNSIIFTLLRGYVKFRNRRNFGAFGATSRYIEPNAHYFRLVEPLFKLLVHAGIEFRHRLRLMPIQKVDVLLAALPS